MSEKQESGFEPIPRAPGYCVAAGHNAPAYLCVPKDQRYRHVCPACGKVQYVYASVPLIC